MSNLCNDRDCPFYNCGSCGNTLSRAKLGYCRGSLEYFYDEQKDKQQQEDEKIWEVPNNDKKY